MAYQIVLEWYQIVHTKLTGPKCSYTKLYPLLFLSATKIIKGICLNVLGIDGLGRRLGIVDYVFGDDLGVLFLLHWI